MPHQSLITLKKRREERSGDQFLLWKEMDLVIQLLEVTMEGIASTEAALAQLKADSEARDVATSQALADLKAEVGRLESSGVDTTSLNATIATLDAAVKTGTSEAQAADPGAQATQEAKPTKTVYTFTASEGVTADSRFAPSGFREKGTFTALFYFEGDTDATSQNGASVPGYAVFSGEVEAVPASA
jgi:hypothetical protein